MARPTPSLSSFRLTDGAYGRGFCRMVALTVRMELVSVLVIGYGFFCAFFSS